MAYKFKIGDRVHLSPDGRSKYEHQAPDGLVGIVTSYSGPYHRVRWGDGSENSYQAEYLEAAAPVAPVAPVAFESVILADDKKREILDAISQVEHFDKIFKEWGFASTMEKGKAISLLFWGPPGTGKTLMAQAIADKFGKALRVISTAEIETPEPGGAERNLRKAFNEADKDTVLLFDECDSLITDRSRVGMILAAQINALLTELERFEGVAIFTTNRLGALDPAFERRLSLKMEFALPSAAERVKIWQRMFPVQAPLSKDIDWEKLASVEIAGGHIKNVVLKAARHAAATGQIAIAHEHLAKALVQEVRAHEAYTQALAAYDPFYGTPLEKTETGKLSIKKS